MVIEIIGLSIVLYIIVDGCIGEGVLVKIAEVISNNCLATSFQRNLLYWMNVIQLDRMLFVASRIGLFISGLAIIYCI